MDATGRALDTAGMLHAIASAVLATFACLPAQSPATQDSKRASLADGLVRQQIELQQLTPPRLTTGQEIAEGDGPLVLMILHKDFKAEFLSLKRGYGDFGAAPEPHRPIGEQETEVPEAEQPAPGAPAPTPTAPTAAAAAPAPADVTKHTLGLAVLHVDQRGDDLVVSANDRATPLHHTNPTSAEMAKVFADLFAATKGAPSHGQLLLEAKADVPMQAVLSLWSTAREQGFVAVNLSNLGLAPQPLTEVAKQLEALPREQEWPGRPFGPVTLYGGELLILLDGPATWHDIGPVFATCARVGIWQIAFVGTDGKRRFKLPMHIPTDG